jgi:dihydrofolate reductase
MRKIITTTFVSLDGVMQAPGGPDEDPTNGFKWGGWTFNYWDEKIGKEMDEFMSQPFDLLLGRRTYEIFAAYWPYEKNGAIADHFNRTAKYVVSHNNIDLTWKHSNLVTGDVAGELRKLKKQDGNDLWVHGSGNLIQTLLKNELVDKMYVWTFPVTFGRGKKLLEEGIPAKAWNLTYSKISSTGVMVASYEPAGEIKPGSFVQQEPSKEELKRREKLAKESA